MAKDIDLEVKVIEDITARNAGLSTGHLQCMMTTMDSTVVARAADIPVKHIAVPSDVLWVWTKWSSRATSSR